MLTNIMYTINEALKDFKPHGLNDLKKAALMRRIDSKFIVPIAMAGDIIHAVKDYYSVLEINNKRVFEYKNAYYDTSDMHFYNCHHNGKLNRYKVRHREYVDAGTSFLEVKFKNNKKCTNKTRVKTSNTPDAVINNEETFLQQSGIANPADLRVVQNSGYNRIALANEEAAERVTIDQNLHFTSVETGRTEKINGFIIAELKQASLNRHSPFYKLMRQANIRPVSFSKYCMGLCFTSGNLLKTNRFKRTRIEISKLVA